MNRARFVRWCCAELSHRRQLMRGSVAGALRNLTLYGGPLHGAVNTLLRLFVVSAILVESEMTGAVEIAIENWLHGLTPREYQVALMVGRGLSNKEVARGLGISDGTVKLHVHNIFQKLGARNRYGLIQRMVSSGFAE